LPEVRQDLVLRQVGHASTEISQRCNHPLRQAHLAAAAQVAGLIRKAGSGTEGGRVFQTCSKLAAATRLIADRLADHDPAAEELASLCAFWRPSRSPRTYSLGAPVSCLASWRPGWPIGWPGGRPWRSWPASRWLGSTSADCSCIGLPRPSCATA
jgi:hypothetical protein